MAAKKKAAAKKASAPKAKKPKASVTARLDEKICFVVMPFGGWFDDYYANIYKPAIEESGLTAFRADDLYRPSNIVNDIWSYTQRAKIILADLSGKNANVFYELGLAHALAKPAILITESLDDVPFDLRSLRVIEYDKNDPTWGTDLKESIVAAIGEVLESPMHAVLPAFLTVKADQKPKSVSESEMQYLELKQEIERLRSEVYRTRASVRPRHMTSSEAKERIRRYMEVGAPDEHIIRRLTDVGISENWVRRRISLLREDSNQASLLKDEGELGGAGNA